MVREVVLHWTGEGSQMFLVIFRYDDQASIGRFAGLALTMAGAAAPNPALWTPEIPTRAGLHTVQRI